MSAMDEDYDNDDAAEELSEEEAGSPIAGATPPADAAAAADADADPDDDAADAAAASTPKDDKAGADEEAGVDEEGAEEEAGDDEFDDAFDEVFEEDDIGDAAQAPGPAAAEEGAAAAETTAQEASEAGPSQPGPGPGSRVATQDEVVARKKRIMDSLTEQQLDRYESYRRSSLARPKVKKMVSSLLGYAVNDKSIIALCGMGKVFVGELVETARVLAAEEGHHGPLLPRHIHWAYQNLNCERKIPRRQPAKRLLR